MRIEEGRILMTINKKTEQTLNQTELVVEEILNREGVQARIDDFVDDVMRAMPKPSDR